MELCYPLSVIIWVSAKLNMYDHCSSLPGMVLHIFLHKSKRFFGLVMFWMLHVKHGALCSGLPQ